MAVGQLSKEATIVSKLKGTTKGFRATIDFDQFEKHNIDGVQRSKAKDERQLEKKDKQSNKAKETFPIGECLIEEIEYDNGVKDTHFTRIELNSVREDVQRKIEGINIEKLSIEAPSQKKYTATFYDLIDLLLEKEKSSQLQINGKKVPKLSEYFYEMLLWELAVYSPLPYPDMTIFQNGQLKHFNELVCKADFELIVDGYYLKKPFPKSFLENDNTYPKKIFKWENEIYFNNYHVSAYLIFQSGTMIRPKAMQGVLVRENNVAVGLYDKSYLNYPFFEGSKFDHLTGEIYVDGLAGAMNVDRDSFNITDEVYVKLTEWFHNKLYKEVFTEIDKIQTERRKLKEKSNVEEYLLNILKPILSNSKVVKKIQFKALGRKTKSRFLFEKKNLTVNTSHKDCKINTSNSEKLLLALSLIASEEITIDTIELILNEITESKLAINRQ